MLELALAIALQGPASAAPAAQPQLEAAHELILCVPRAAWRARIDARLAAEGLRVLEELPALGLLRAALPAGMTVDSAVQRIEGWPGVAYAEPNGLGQGGGLVPDDTWFPEQWPLDNQGQNGGTAGADIEALRGWELARGSPGVLVAVLDSGLILDHPEFLGRTVPGHDFVNEDDDPTDDHGHGTRVTGILAANADNGFGLAGVDRHCTLLPVKVLDRFNRGTTFDLAQGLTHAADAGARVVSMSLINYPVTQTLNSALQYARDAGCILIACAGNGGPGDADRSFPGRSVLTISVGATTRSDARASFSGTGVHLDLVAPGLAVPATTRALTDTFSSFSGCSAATPVVSGIAAVTLSLNPGLTHDQMRALLFEGAEDQVGPPASDPPGRDDQFGAGRANLLRTLCALDAGGPTISAPERIPIECDRPGGLPGDAPAVLQALALIAAFDDLDPAPELELEVPAFLPLAATTILACTAFDACGNHSARTVEILVLDSTPPLLALTASPGELDPSDARLVEMAIAAPTRDACDRAPEVQLSVWTDEPDPRRGQRDARFDPQGSLALLAERDEDGDGRVYLLLARASDDSGNASTRCATVVVPHDRTPASLAAVRQQAARARAACEDPGQAPAGFTRLGGVTLPKAPDPGPVARPAPR